MASIEKTLLGKGKDVIGMGRGEKILHETSKKIFPEKTKKRNDDVPLNLKC